MCVAYYVPCHLHLCYHVLIRILFLFLFFPFLFIYLEFSLYVYQRAWSLGVASEFHAVSDHDPKLK